MSHSFNFVIKISIFAISKCSMTQRRKGAQFNADLRDKVRALQGAEELRCNSSQRR